MPCETLSPTFTLTSCTTPSASAGTSIDAFSLSSVISESFFLTRSPGLTSTSMTGTSLKSPMSGTRTSIVCAGDGAAGAAAGAVAAAAVDVASTTIGIPCETLSPTFTLTSCTTPSASAGTSIDAFSLSSVMSESFFLTRSPGLTSTSMTGTSLKSPMSGTRTSIVLLIAHQLFVGEGK